MHLTDASLSSLYTQIEKLDSVHFQVFITDGGSTDGTAELISLKFPQARLLHSHGAFWNSGMLYSWSKALESGFDYYLWLNDDVQLFDGIIDQLILTLKKSIIFEKQIFVGSTLEPGTERHSYGPLKIKHKFSPLNFQINNSNSVKSSTFNGNFVVVSHLVVCQIGLLDSQFSHSFGDIDYGLRATREGIKISHLPFIVGFCAKNREWSAIQSGKSAKLSFSFILTHPKGIPYKEWYLFTKRHGGNFWLLRFFYRYVRIFINFLKTRFVA
jgi:GT2 family glycosyltransferase